LLVLAAVLSATPQVAAQAANDPKARAVELARLQDEMTQLKAEIETLKGQNKALREQIETLQGADKVFRIYHPAYWFWAESLPWIVIALAGAGAFARWWWQSGRNETAERQRADYSLLLKVLEAAGGTATLDEFKTRVQALEDRVIKAESRILGWRALQGPGAQALVTASAAAHRAAASADSAAVNEKAAADARAAAQKVKVEVDTARAEGDAAGSASNEPATTVEPAAAKAAQTTDGAPTKAKDRATIAEPKTDEAGKT
jgi:hypothetical protein